jgi:pimeloyl-ACP methyl ester carboxylesterase
MAAVRSPVLLLWGASDPLLPPPAAQALARHLVNASVSTLMLPDASHYPPIEIPDRYAHIVESFIRDVVPRVAGS